MFKFGLVGLTVVVLGASGATAATVAVSAKDAVASKLVGLDSGVQLQLGQEFIVSTDVDAKWTFGKGRKSNRVNADGKIGKELTLGDDTFNRGALVGRIGDGEFFLIGSENTLLADGDGSLELFIWDKKRRNNRGSLMVNIDVPEDVRFAAGPTDDTDTRGLISTVPVPAGAPLLLAGIGAFAALRRRKAR